jgi:hypothetical protein
VGKIVILNKESNGEDVEVDKYIIASFARQEDAKLWEKGVVYVDSQGLFTCPFHPGKPKDGRRDCLIDHAKSIANSNRNYKQKGQHLALLRMMFPEDHH